MIYIIKMGSESAIVNKETFDKAMTKAKEYVVNRYGNISRELVIIK